MNVIDRLQKIVNFDDPNTLKYQIAEYLLFNQKELANKSMREIAAHIHTSAPSILRFVQALNYDNLEDFQYHYNMNIQYASAVMKSIYNYKHDFTQEQQAAINHLEKLITNADIIVITGGLYEISGMMMQQAFLIEMGKKCYILGFDNYEEQIKLLNKLKPNDLVIMVSAGMNYEDLEFKNKNVYAKGGIPALAFDKTHHLIEFFGPNTPYSRLSDTNKFLASLLYKGQDI